MMGGGVKAAQILARRLVVRRTRLKDLIYGSCPRPARLGGGMRPQPPCAGSGGHLELQATTGWAAKLAGGGVRRGLLAERRAA